MSIKSIGREKSGPVFRVEDKYALSGQQMDLLETRLQGAVHPDRHSAGAGYRISSLYFDDLRDSCYYDSLDGNPQRDKYRIRIYNDSMDMIRLEVKRKLYNRAYKLTSVITTAELEELKAGRCIREESGARDNAKRLFNLAVLTRGLRPRTVVTYERKAYVTAAGNVRITFDRNLRASGDTDAFGRDTQHLQYSYVTDPLYPELAGNILEVKYDQFLSKYIAQLLETGEMQQTSNSKYCLCRDTLDVMRLRKL